MHPARWGILLLLVGALVAALDLLDLVALPLAWAGLLVAGIGLLMVVLVPVLRRTPPDEAIGPRSRAPATPHPRRTAHGDALRWGALVLLWGVIVVAAVGADIVSPYVAMYVAGVVTMALVVYALVQGARSRARREPPSPPRGRTG